MIILNTKSEKLIILIISLTLILYCVCYHDRFSVFETSKENQNKSMRYSNKTLKISLQNQKKANYEYNFQKNSDKTLFKVRERRQDMEKSLNPIQVPNRFETQTSFEKNPQAYYEEQMPVVVHAESDFISDVGSSSFPEIKQTSANTKFLPSKLHPEREEVEERNYDQSENDEGDDMMNDQLDYYSDQELPYNHQYYENPESIEKEDSYQMRLPEEQEHQSAEVFKGPLSEYYDPYFMKEPSTKYEKPTDPKTSSVQQNDDSLYPIQNVYRTPTVTRIAATPTQVNIKESSGINTVFRKLKTLWNLYRVFTKAWNVLADYRQTSQAKQQEQQEQKQQQEQKEQQQKQQHHQKQEDSQAFFNPQTRLKMENPLKISSTYERYNKSSSATTTTSKSTVLPTLLKKVNGDLSKILKGDPGRKIHNNNNNNNNKNSRRRREQHRSNKEKTLETDNQMIAAEGRYIKGDPLKGYYDFVLTEGSYKFWAVFQLGTAILIIYSTFAAIYYTKINPFVADYDYHDYLGGNPGARSFSGDVDFDDDDGGGGDDGNDDDDDAAGRRSNLNLRNWVPKMRHSVKFILEAIDKIPVDHEEGEKGKEE